MSSVVTVLTVIFSVILTPFLIFFCGIVVLAALGRTLGVRRLYVKLLLRVFEVRVSCAVKLSFITRLHDVQCALDSRRLNIRIEFPPVYLEIRRTSLPIMRLFVNEITTLYF